MRWPMPASVSCRAIANANVPLRMMSARPPRLAKARRDGAEQPAARHINAERVRPDQPASRCAGNVCRRERIVHRHIFGHRHDGFDARLRAFGDRVGARLRPAV